MPPTFQYGGIKKKLAKYKEINKVLHCGRWSLLYFNSTYEYNLCYLTKTWFNTGHHSDWLQVTIATLQWLQVTIVTDYRSPQWLITGHHSDWLQVTIATDESTSKIFFRTVKFCMIISGIGYFQCISIALLYTYIVLYLSAVLTGFCWICCATTNGLERRVQGTDYPCIGGSNPTVGRGCRSFGWDRINRGPVSQ
jgi:hypothetical protein